MRFFPVIPGGAMVDLKRSPVVILIESDPETQERMRCFFQDFFPEVIFFTKPTPDESFELARKWGKQVIAILLNTHIATPVGIVEIEPGTARKLNRTIEGHLIAYGKVKSALQRLDRAGAHLTLAIPLEFQDLQKYLNDLIRKYEKNRQE